MNLTMKEKAKLFWDRNRELIIGLAGMAFGGCLLGIGVHCTKKNEEQRKKELEAQKQAKLEEERREAAQEAAMKNNPANQLAGGYFRPDNDTLYDPEYPSILVNTVPIANMGELGQEVIQRLNEEWFGEFGETGVGNPFDPATATVDIVIDFGHEVWKRNHPEEVESQEKQAS